MFIRQNLASSSVRGGPYIYLFWYTGIIKFYNRYHLDLCKNVFGEGVYPNVDETNIYYGGTKIAGMPRLIF